jgi:hypothetical protein
MSNQSISALRDQVWADLRQHKEDIVRIALGRITTNPKDIALIIKVFSAVAGDLQLREDGDICEL